MNQLLRNDPAILIIGITPPPIGGVSTHVKRWLEVLDREEFPYDFTDVRKTNAAFLIKSLLKHQIVHLHVSNTTYRLCLVLIGKITSKKIILTFHGNYNRWSKIRNFFDRMCIRLSDIPIMINQNSKNKAKKINSNAIYIPAFIPPQTKNEEPLPKDILEKITEFKSTCSAIFATNAFRVHFDSQGREIYQLTGLVKIFKKLFYLALIISDPSGTYKNYFKENNVSIPENVLLISEPHSFYRILQCADTLLRITTTDGDSLSVKEAMFLGKKVIATNVVNRPEGVILTSLREDEIETQIIESLKKMPPTVVPEDGTPALLNLYKGLLSGRPVMRQIL